MIRKQQHLQLKNDLAEFDRLMPWLQEWGTAQHFPGTVQYALQLSLEEVVTNVIKYGYRDTADHVIDLRFDLQGDQLTVEIEDDAQAFNPLDKSDPNLSLELEDRPIGGLGIYLVKQMMDSVEYRRVRDHNLLILRKRIKEEQ